MVGLSLKGGHERENAISEGLCKRFLENGMPQDMLTRFREGEAAV